MAAARHALKLLKPTLQSMVQRGSQSGKILTKHSGNGSFFSHIRCSPAFARSISSTQCSKNFVPLGNAALDSEAHIDSIKNSLILDESEKRETLVEKVKKAISEDQPFNRIFAVIHIGGKQFKVTSNDIIMIHKVPAKCGDKIRLQKILMVGGREFSLIGKPLLSTDHVYIEATVLEKTKGRNIIIFKKKRRKNYKRWIERRQDLTVLRINKIILKPELVQ